MIFRWYCLLAVLIPLALMSQTQAEEINVADHGVNYSKPVKVTAVGKNRIRFNANGRALPRSDRY
ncbi:hypothetical protein [Novipirellula sp.]|uniref:hypothetical protein n=1 Tax=Novipirellula sp. TaxID=2795430 RepID=UPI003563C90C